MTDTPNEQAPATRSEWLALMREAVRLEMEDRDSRPTAPEHPFASVGDLPPRKTHLRVVPQPPSEG